MHALFGLIFFILVALSTSLEMQSVCAENKSVGSRIMQEKELEMCCSETVPH